MARTRSASAPAASGIPAVGDLPIRMVPIKLLKAAKYNPRKISPDAKAALEASIDRFGNVGVIVWNERTGNVVGGHRRVEIGRARREKLLATYVVNIDPEDERALNIALNSPTAQGTFDPAKLAPLLEQLAANRTELYAQLGLSDLSTLFAPPKAPPVHEDDPPEPPADPETRAGDVIVLGTHRLICGDAVHKATLAKLLGNEKVDSLVTDPPYGVDYSAKQLMLNRNDGGKRNTKAIANDVGRDYRKWFASWLAGVPWAEYATFFVFMSGLELHNLRLAIGDVGLTFGEYLVWVKNGHVLGRKDYNTKHEFVLYGWAQRHRFYGKGKKNKTTVLEYDRPTKSDLHPTMKPVALCEQLIGDGSPAGGIVLDLFGGSGSTLIAAEHQHRRARVVELDPRYCDVIVTRWERLTGKKAKRLREGVSR